MKKINLLFYAILSIIPVGTYSKFIQILAEDGTTLHISDSETIQGFFEKCRKDRYCTADRGKLALDFNNKLIKEGSSEAYKTLYDHSSLFAANKAVVARLQYPNQNDNRTKFIKGIAQDFFQESKRNKLIDIEAPNGRIKQCSSHDTPAYFFRKCRSYGDCRDTTAMTLRFGPFEIKEGSETANRPFYTFQTDSSFAQVKRS